MSVSVMLKPASSNCNLACRYCFYHSLASERAEYSKGYMTLDTAKNVIDSALALAQGTEVFFTFQGGEPLLCSLDFYKAFIDYVREHNDKHSAVSYCLQTNATLITEEYVRFFAENHFLVGVSLDGDEELNKYRVYPDERESFSDVMTGVEYLKKHNVKFNILSVLTKNTALNFRRAYRFFKLNELRYIQFIIGLRPMKSEYDENMYMSTQDYSYFLTKCFNIYFNDYMRGEYVSIRSFDNYIALAGGKNAEQCGMNGFCGNQFVVEGDGSVYPCDFYCSDKWYLGNINDTLFKEMFDSQLFVEFIKESFKLSDECKECKYFYICRGGGCKRNRFDKDYCESYKQFFSSSDFKLEQIVKRGG